MASSFEQWPEHFSLAVLRYTQVYKSNIGINKLLVQCNGVLVGVTCKEPVFCPGRGGKLSAVWPQLLSKHKFTLPFRMCVGLIARCVLPSRSSSLT